MAYVRQRVRATTRVGEDRAKRRGEEGAGGNNRIWDDNYKLTRYGLTTRPHGTVWSCLFLFPSPWSFTLEYVTDYPRRSPCRATYRLSTVLNC